MPAFEQVQLRRSTAALLAHSRECAGLARSANCRAVAAGIEAGRALLRLRLQLSPGEWRAFLAESGTTGKESERLAFLAQHRAEVEANQTERCRAILLVGAAEAD